MKPAVEIPDIVLHALDAPEELAALLVERIKLDALRLDALGFKPCQIVEMTGLGSRYGRPLGRRTGVPHVEEKRPAS